jgi:hypothetical protein
MPLMLPPAADMKAGSLMPASMPSFCAPAPAASNCPSPIAMVSKAFPSLSADERLDLLRQCDGGV